MTPAGERGRPGDLGWAWVCRWGNGGGLTAPSHSCDSGGDCECLCSAIATYADECARHGIYVRWRSQELCREYARPSVYDTPSRHPLSSSGDTSGLRAIHSFIHSWSAYYEPDAVLDEPNMLRSLLCCK